MKNKTTLYILGLAVALIWGLVIYRVFAAVKGDDDYQPVSPKAAKETFDDFSPLKDTAVLQLNYRDPFGLIKPKDTAKAVIRNSGINMNGSHVNITPRINWEFIRYSGFIRNPVSKKLIALVTINGHEVMLNEGETADNVRLIKNLGDSIRISYTGKTKFIRLKPAS